MHAFIGELVGLRAHRVVDACMQREMSNQHYALLPTRASGATHGHPSIGVNGIAHRHIAF